MFLRSKALYTLKALLLIARHEKRNVGEIAEALSISNSYAEILMKSVVGVFVDGKKGPGGGYILRMDSQDIYVSLVLHHIATQVIALDTGGGCDDIEFELLTGLQALTLADLNRRLKEETP
jgi:DNA-binding IscR family transcriptional regulator